MKKNIPVSGISFQFSDFCNRMKRLLNSGTASRSISKTMQTIDIVVEDLIPIFPDYAFSVAFIPCTVLLKLSSNKNSYTVL